MLWISSCGSNDGASFDVPVLNALQCLFEVVCFLAGLELNMPPLGPIIFQNLRLYTIHVANDRLWEYASIQARGQGTITGEHHVRSFNQRHDDIIVGPFSGGKHDTCLTCHMDG